MSAKFDIEGGLRALIVQVIRDEVRRVVADATRADEFLSTSAAARVAEVTPGTIRRWIKEDKLARYQAGRELRISRANLETLLKRGTAENDELTPEEMAEKVFG